MRPQVKFSTTYLIPEEDKADMLELRYHGYELAFSDGLGVTIIRQNGVYNDYIR